MQRSQTSRRAMYFCSARRVGREDTETAVKATC